MWLLFLIALAYPLWASAQNVGDLSPNPYNNNTLGNPFSPGGSLSFIPQRTPNAGRAAPTSPYSWSNVAPLPAPPLPMANISDPSSTHTRNAVSPHVPGSAFGPYGITLPPDHPLGMGSR